MDVTWDHDFEPRCTSSKTNVGAVYVQYFTLSTQQWSQTTDGEGEDTHSK
eukprot:m.104845 g.104845  ORF g.104845 m.104845 type:complete len:50 (-) comp13264_c1_seq1:330-479(-)